MLAITEVTLPRCGFKSHIIYYYLESHQKVTGVMVNNSSHFLMIILMALNVAGVTKYGTLTNPVTFKLDPWLVAGIVSG